MHICFLCSEYPPFPHGGVGSFTQTLARGLASAGQRVSVVGTYSIREKQVSEEDGVHIFRLPASRIPKTGFLLHRLRLWRQIKTIHQHCPIDLLEGPELSFAFMPRQYFTRRVIRMHGGHYFFAVTLGKQPSPWRARQERSSFARADGLCAVSQFVAEETRRLLKLGVRPVTVLPNPVDLAKFAPHPEIQEEAGLILFAGTVCEKKGVRQLIQAMPAVLRAVPLARLWIAGRDWQDPQTGASYIDGVKSSVPMALKEKIRFIGQVPREQMPALMAQAQVLALPSHMEAQGIVFLEGMACQKAIIGPLAGPVPELIENGVSGLLCDPHDPASIADKIILALKDRELRISLGIAARKRTISAFSMDALLQKNIDFYHNVISSP
jgi:glycosyltransferase involved in cell wall biosynthesis